MRFSIRVTAAYSLAALVVLTANIHAESLPVWPDLAPGEMSRETGTLLPFRENESPPISRVTKIRLPTIDVFLADKPNGTGLLILPGGGFGKVVPDKEGSEAAPWLNKIGISVFVLRYRTNEATPRDEPAWRRPLQDAQRALRIMHARADEWKLDPDRIGVLGFSAGGQVATILHGDIGPAYKPIDAIDEQSCRPDFSLLVYPWKVTDPKSNKLWSHMKLSEKSAPAFIVHTHDDASTSLGSVAIYAKLKKAGVSTELHVYENGGHGYGMRDVKNSNIGNWRRAANDWLLRRKLGRTADH